MRVGVVVQAYGEQVVGGAEWACRELCRHLAREAEVTVLTTCAAEPMTWANRLPPGESADGDVRVVRFPVARPRSSGFNRLSRRLFARERPPRPLQERWVRAQGPEAPGLVEEVRRRSEEFDVWVFHTYLYYPTIFGLPPVASRAVLHPALHDEPPARLPIVREVVRAAAGLGFYAPEEWELALRLAGWPPSRARVVGLGVEEGGGDEGAFRETFGLESDPYLLYLGRVDRGKGTDDLVRAFSAFKRGRPGPLRLVVAGPIVHRPPVHDDIVVPGRLSEEQKWAALEGCTAFVHPSPYESFGLVLMEAWTKSRPALVDARSPVTSGHVRRARGGLAFRDHAEFAAALEVILDDPAAAARLGAGGRAYAEGFLWDRVMQRYRALLEEVAGGAR